MSSFEFRPGEEVPHAVRRIVRHQIDSLRAELRRAPRQDAVREARKSSKKLRAVVRLVRDQIGEKRYRRENTTLRDAVRPLGRVRDAEVLAHSLDLLAERFAEDLRLRTLDAVRRALCADARRVRGAPATRAAVRHASALAGRVRARLRKWALERRGWRVVRPGIARIYRRARAAKRRADRDPSVECLHEWRKRTKDLRYALELFEPAWPPVIDAFEEELHALTDRLGDHQDLTRLEDRVRAAPEACGTSRDCAALVGLIDARRAELLAEARPIAERVFSEKPRAFVARLHGYWAARDGGGR